MQINKKNIAIPSTKITQSSIDYELSDKSLRHFTRTAWPVLDRSEFQQNWHTDAICDHLEACSRGQIKRLIINVPPGCGKSLITCVMWFCWHWTKWPWSRWLYTTYEQKFAHRDSNKCRDLIKSDWYQERWSHQVELRKDQDTMGRFTNTEYGFRLATSVKGTGTGERVHFIVADDPIKIQFADRETEREMVNHSWDQVISGRGVSPDETCFVVIMQRLHENDLTGHLLAKDEGFEHLMLPMEFDPQRACSTSIGFKDPRTEEEQLLWPERWPAHFVEQWKRTLGPQGTSGQLAQSPKLIRQGAIFSSRNFQRFTYEESVDQESDSKEPVLWFLLKNREGEIIKRWRADLCNWFQTVDTAMKTSQLNDYTVVGTFAITPDLELLVVEMKRRRISIPEQYDFIPDQQKVWPYVLFQAIEDKQSGTGIIQQGRISGHPYRTLTADQDKVRRASTVATLYRNDLVYHLDGRMWLTDFESELENFPLGKFDDQVDVVAYAGILYKTEELLRSFNRAVDERKLVYPDEEALEEIRREASEDAIKIEINGVTLDFDDTPDDNPFR